MNQAKEEEYFIPSEEANEVERLLVEPQNDQVSVDGILFGWPASNATEEGEDISKLNALDAMPLQVEGGNHLSTTCEDYLLDTGFAESVTNLDYNASERLNFGNSGSGSQIMEFILRDNLHIDKAIWELNGNLGHKYNSETSIEDNWLKYHPNSESQNVEKLDDNEMIFCPDLITKNSVLNSNSSAIHRQKRLRKPTRRYMDESSDLNSRFCRKRQGDSTTSTSKDRFRGVKFRKNNQRVGTREVASTDESFCKAIQVPFSPRGPKEFQKKRLSTEMQTYIEESPSPAESEDESVIAVRSEENCGPRKHHKLWTLSEVRMLIDGVSQHGVGKWTQIKKLLFSSSPHRTPVDLKDKWRNLLKASSALKQRKGEDEQKRNQPWRPLPKSMLRRVSELAAIYPYPRGDGRKFNLSHAN